MGFLNSLGSHASERWNIITTWCPGKLKIWRLWSFFMWAAIQKDRSTQKHQLRIKQLMRTKHQFQMDLHFFKAKESFLYLYLLLYIVCTKQSEFCPWLAGRQQTSSKKINTQGARQPSTTTIDHLISCYLERQRGCCRGIRLLVRLSLCV